MLFPESSFISWTTWRGRGSFTPGLLPDSVTDLMEATSPFFLPSNNIHTEVLLLLLLSVMGSREASSTYSSAYAVSQSRTILSATTVVFWNSSSTQCSPGMFFPCMLEAACQRSWIQSVPGLAWTTTLAGPRFPRTSLVWNCVFVFVFVFVFGSNKRGKNMVWNGMHEKFRQVSTQSCEIETHHKWSRVESATKNLRDPIGMQIDSITSLHVLYCMSIAFYSFSMETLLYDSLNLRRDHDLVGHPGHHIRLDSLSILNLTNVVVVLVPSRFSIHLTMDVVYRRRNRADSPSTVASCN